MTEQKPTVVGLSQADSPTGEEGTAESKLLDNEYELAERLDKLLSQFTKRAGRKAMIMYHAIRRQRVIPIGLPVGVTNTASAVGGPKANKPKGPKRQQKAAWRQDPRWTAAVAAREEIVSRLKAADDTAKAMIQSELRFHEAGLKKLKNELRA